MKRFLLMMLMASSLVACSSCTKKTTDPIIVDGNVPGPSTTATNPPVPPEDASWTVAGETWSMDVPSRYWSMRLEDVPDDTVVLVNLHMQNVVLVTDRPFSGGLEPMALATMRDLRGAGATIVSAKQLTVDGHNFVLIDSFKGDDVASAWVTATGTRGVEFHCGGPAKTEQEVTCQVLFKGFKIKG